MTMTAPAPAPPTAPARPYDVAFLRGYSEEHVHYEFDMLFWAACTYGKTVIADTADEARRLANVVVESFPVHLRNVIEFLYRGTPTPNRYAKTYKGGLRPTDVAAADFCPNGWTPPEISQALTDAHERADKEVGHLTSSRLPAGDKRKEWAAEALMKEIMPTIRLFVQAADPDRLSPKVAALVAAQK